MLIHTLLQSTLLFLFAATAQATPSSDNLDGVPPRLSYTYGEVSFWRPGAEDWTVAQVNTPLAPGDALFTADGASAEVQIGGQAFIRAGSETELVLSNRELNYLQFEVSTGQVGFDARSLAPGSKVEIDTPHAAFTIEVGGYYRLDVAGDTTTFVTYRGGRATMLLAAGTPETITAGERVIVGGETSVVRTAAPDFDAWDDWNYERTDHLIKTASSRYVSPDVYGLEELDRHGTWHEEREYGPVWIPSNVGPDWAPYTAGRWIWDPFYGWTWIDAAPWGWAPCHYGRWVRVRGYWGWAPGPVIVRPVYAPAVVAFFGGSSFSVGIGISGPAIGWVALGWGEPIVPWWGTVGFVGVPWWGGWGGPFVVNNIVIKHKTVIHKHHIHKYHHARHGIVYDRSDRFGRGHHRYGRWRDVDEARLQPIHGKHPVRPVAASLSPRGERARRPSDDLRRRPVVATRPGRDVRGRLREAGLRVPDNPTRSRRIVSRSGGGADPGRRNLAEERRPPTRRDRDVSMAERRRPNVSERTSGSRTDRPDRLQRGARPELPIRRDASPRSRERTVERSRPAPPQADRTRRDRLARPRLADPGAQRPSESTHLSRPAPPARRSEQPRQRSVERRPVPQRHQPEARVRGSARPDVPTRRIEQPSQNVRPRVQREEQRVRRDYSGSPRIEERSSPRPRLESPRATAPQAARQPSYSRSQLRGMERSGRSQPSSPSHSLRSAPSSSSDHGRANMRSFRGGSSSAMGGRGLSRGR